MQHLHSNMVRFIIKLKQNKNGLEQKIYIPIWLDLLSAYQRKDQNQMINLHSNMVRFIISLWSGIIIS